jgi:alkylation response protein AidB-like acyl-CoA dehydrogenase
VPRLLPENTWTADEALQSLLKSWLLPARFDWAKHALIDMGRAAAAELQAWGDACERQPATLRSFDAWGNRIDEVVYPQAWHQIAAASARAGLVGLPYEDNSLARLGWDARLIQAALCYLFAPSTATYLCPVAMTDGAARVLADFGSPRQRGETLVHLTSRDPEQAWTSGQWMTERQGGSDVGRNAVTAKREDDGWRLYGQKFFCSNIGCEVALALARPEGAPSGTQGLGLFLVPREVDGRRNTYRIDRLKDKLGTRAMATGEVTLDGTTAELVGDVEQGFTQMTSMLNITRLHNAITAAATMRRGCMLVSAYAAEREAFGRKLDQHALFREVVCDMEAEADAALYLTMRMAQLLGRIEINGGTSEERALFRLGTALAKLYTAKQAVAVMSEAIECFGGQGYMEDTGLPRLLRDAQVLTIWEGPTNVLALDALRVLRKPDAFSALVGELVRLDAPERNRVLDLAQATVEQGDERLARRVAYSLSEAWMAGLLHAAGRDAVVARLKPRGTGLRPQ